MSTDTAFQEGQQLDLASIDNNPTIPVTFVRYLAGECVAMVRIDSRYGDRVETAWRYVNVRRLAVSA